MLFVQYCEIDGVSDPFVPAVALIPNPVASMLLRVVMPHDEHLQVGLKMKNSLWSKSIPMMGTPSRFDAVLPLQQTNSVRMLMEPPLQSSA